MPPVVKKKILITLCLIVLVLLAFQVRCLFDNEVFYDGGVHFLDGDSCYHMRRVDFCLRDFPRLPGFDAYMGYPDGALCPWPPLFDLIAASVFKALLFLTNRAVEEAPRLAVYFNPVLGSLALIPLYLFTRRVFSPAAGLIACAVLAVLSGHIHYSRLGNFDHHEALSFFALLFMTALAYLTFPVQGKEPSARSKGIAGFLGGIFIASAILTWTGCLLFAAIGEIYLLILLLTDKEDRRASLLPCILLLHAVWFLFTLPFAARSGWNGEQPFSIIMLSWFHAIVPAAGFFYYLYLLLIERYRLKKKHPVLLGLTFYFLFPVIIFALLLFLTDFREAVRSSTIWLQKTSAFMSRVPESQPLFYQRAIFTTGIANARLSFFLYLSPFLLIGMIRTSLREGLLRFRILFMIWTVGMIAITLLQKRFFNCLAINIAILAGFGLVASYHLLKRTKIGKKGGFLMLFFLTLALLWPSFNTFLPKLSGDKEAIWKLKGSGMASDFSRSMEAAYVWIRENTPPTRYYYNPTTTPEYGVFANWSWGHQIAYISQRPSVVNNFGDYVNPDGFADSFRFGTILEEEEAIKILRKYRSPYTITTVNLVPCVDGARAQNAFRHMYHRLHLADGSGAPVPLMEGKYTFSPEPLKHFRLLFEAGKGKECLGRIPAMVKIFQHVPGARVTVSSSPWEEVTVSSDIKTNTGRKFAYLTKVITDKEGNGEVTLPYATQTIPHRTNATAPYLFISAGGEASLEVTERDVLEGKNLHVAIPQDIIRRNGR